MTIISDERVERAARALCRAEERHCGGLHICDRFPVCKCPCWIHYEDVARAALEADAPEIAEAERRGRIDGLREAAAITKGFAEGKTSYSFRTGAAAMAIRALLPETAAKREEG